MIVLTINPDASQPIAVTNPEYPGHILVRVPGAITRAQLDQILDGAGAGRAPGHHAELRIRWLTSHPDVRSGSSVHRLEFQGGGTLIDESGEWVMAPIEWDDCWVHQAVPLAS